MRKNLNLNSGSLRLYKKGIDGNFPIREQKTNPLPDHKALDDVVFDILSLTLKERNEVYWAVRERVKIN